ncbi:ein3-binding f-box protein 3, partial [Genlisea aurea]
VYSLQRKRCRVNAPFVASREFKLPPSIDALPDECLFEILRRLPGINEKSACACVSKRWLMLLSSISRDESYTTEALREFEESSPRGFLSRSVEGKNASDVRLAAIAIGTAARGGLGKLSVRGSKSTPKLTDLGIKAIARCCPSLRVLSLWNLSSISDEGLCEIAHGCRSLEKLELYHCPLITDRALVDIAAKCPDLTSVTLESCKNIGDGSLKAFGSCCPKLKHVSIRSCPLVGDRGISNLFSSAGNILEKAKLQSLSITDVSLAVIGKYGCAVTDLALVDLRNVKERGFWVMGKAGGLQNLKSLSITSCREASDAALQVVAEGCPLMNFFALCDVSNVSDQGLIAFSNSAKSLETLHIGRCDNITQYGVFSVLSNCGRRLKALSIENCLGMKDLNFTLPLTSSCDSLRSLAIVNCPGFGDSGLGMVARICLRLTSLDFSGLPDITDAGILPVVQVSGFGLVKVNLSGCHNLTDNAVASIVELHGENLEVLNLDGCGNITDLSLDAIARNCWSLNELDISRCRITDTGIAILAAAKRLNMKVLSLGSCPLVTDKSLNSLIALGRTLVGLNIQHCRGISSETISVLLDDLWRCDVLY